MPIIRQPTIDNRSQTPYMGIRTQTPMKGMSKVIGQLHKDLTRWFTQTGLEPAGPPFLRYHVIDMAGEMDIEFGYPVINTLPDDGQVRAAVLPAGRYASLVYTGGGIAGNKALLDWARTHGLHWDRWQDQKADAFASRYERYLTDPRDEPRKTKWQIEVAIKLSGE